MTQRDLRTTIHQMIDHCEAARSVAGDLDATAIEASTLHSLALARALELIGEAATRVPPEFRAAHTEVPWRDIIDFRNVLIHAYDVIDYELALRVVNENIPPLITQLRRILDTQDRT